MAQPKSKPKLKSQPAIEAQLDAQKAFPKKIQQGLSKQHEQQSNLQLRQKKKSKQDEQQTTELPQKETQDAKQGRTDESASTTAQLKSISAVTSSASPKISSVPINPIATSATPAVAEISISSHPDTLPPASLTPPDQPSSEPNCNTEAEKALAKTNVSREPIEKAVLDVGDWVELDFDGEEKDDWVQV